MDKQHLILLAIGVALGICLTLVSGAAMRIGDGGLADGHLGQYQVVAFPDGSGVPVVYIFDTTTGGVWARTPDTCRYYGTPTEPMNGRCRVKH